MAIAVVARPKKSDWAIVDATLATYNMVLAAAEMGLGTCWIGTMDREKAKKLLNIPACNFLLTVIPIGYPAKIPSPTPRKSVE